MIQHICVYTYIYTYYIYRNIEDGRLSQSHKSNLKHKKSLYRIFEPEIYTSWDTGLFLSQFCFRYQYARRYSILSLLSLIFIITLSSYLIQIPVLCLLLLSIPFPAILGLNRLFRYLTTLFVDKLIFLEVVKNITVWGLLTAASFVLLGSVIFEVSPQYDIFNTYVSLLKHGRVFLIPS